MRRFSAALFVAILMLFVGNTARADYLEVRRSAFLKEGPKSDADYVAQLSAGTDLQLLNDGVQENGYYNAKVPATGDIGWVYRTLVRRHPGSIQNTSAPLANSELDSRPHRVRGGSAASPNTMKVHYVNVGQGNAAILEFTCGLVMVDAGGESAAYSDALVTYLNKVFSSRPDLNGTIDTIFITHSHKDHNSSLRKVAESFAITNYVYNAHSDGSGRVNAKWMLDHANDNGRQTNIVSIDDDDVLKKGKKAGLTSNAIDPVNCSGVDPDIRILSSSHPTNPGWTKTDFTNENNHSLAIRVKYGQSSFLFVGDLETAGLNFLLSRYSGTQVLQTGVYLVAHHGAENGVSRPMMEAMTPAIAILSCGDPKVQKSWTAWDYGHPRKKAVDMLEEMLHPANDVTPRKVLVGVAQHTFQRMAITKPIFSMAWDGTVVITANDNGTYTVQGENETEVEVSATH